jgi:hypothetical protein
MRYILVLLVAAIALIAFPAQGREFIKPIKSAQINTGPTYDEIHDEALFNCPWAKMTEEKQKIISKLIEIEKRFSPPPEMRGMLLAAACMESGFNPKAKGDRKFSKSKKEANGDWNPPAVAFL